MADLLGVGIKYPFQFDSRGQVARTADVYPNETTPEGRKAHLLMDVTQLLMTAQGERLMRPEFGCGVAELVFDPVTDGLLGLALFQAMDAIKRWEQRIDPIFVDGSVLSNGIEIMLHYRILNQTELEVLGLGIDMGG